jgi:hypothetical protein
MAKGKKVSVHVDVRKSDMSMYWVITEDSACAYVHPEGAPIAFFGRPSLTLITVAKSMDEWCRADIKRFHGSNLRKMKESILGSDPIRKVTK